MPATPPSVTEGERPTVKMLGVVAGWDSERVRLMGATREYPRWRERGGMWVGEKERARSSGMVGERGGLVGACLMVGRTPPWPSGIPESSRADRRRDQSWQLPHDFMCCSIIL